MTLRPLRIFRDLRLVHAHEVSYLALAHAAIHEQAEDRGDVTRCAGFEHGWSHGVGVHGVIVPYGRFSDRLAYFQPIVCGMFQVSRNSANVHISSTFPQ
jgi:hypothetical protein